MEDVRFNVAGRLGLHRAGKPQKWRSRTMRIYIPLSFQTNFLKRKYVYKSMNYRRICKQKCQNQLDLLRLSARLSASNEQLENRQTEFMKFEMNGLLKSVTNRLQHWLKSDNNDFTCISARNSRITRP